MQSKRIARFSALSKKENVLDYLFAHEVGHLIFIKSTKKNKVEIVNQIRNNYKNEKQKFSSYAFNDDDFTDFFAECFAMYIQKDENLSKLDDVKKMIENFL